MNTPDLQVTLTSLGLNEKEVRIYLMLIQLGTSPASVLGDKTGITRSTAQYSCQQLQKKRLVSMAQKGNTFLYTPEPPEKLLYLVQAQQEELDRKERRVSRVIGELRSMMSPESFLPEVKYYEGLDALEQAYRELLSDLDEGDEILSYVQPPGKAQLDDKLLSVIDTFIEGRLSKGVNLRVLTTSNVVAKRRKQSDKQLLRQAREIDPADFLVFPEAPLEILLTSQKMASVSLENGHLFATIMRHKSLVEMHRAAFELAWQQCA